MIVDVTLGGSAVDDDETVAVPDADGRAGPTDGVGVGDEPGADARGVGLCDAPYVVVGVGDVVHKGDGVRDTVPPPDTELVGVRVLEDVAAGVTAAVNVLAAVGVIVSDDKADATGEDDADPVGVNVGVVDIEQTLTPLLQQPQTPKQA